MEELDLGRRDGGETDDQPPAVGTSAPGEGRTEDAGDLLEEVENTATARSGEVEEQEWLLGVRAEQDIGQMLRLEAGLGPMDVDIDPPVRVNLRSVLFRSTVSSSTTFTSHSQIFFFSELENP